MAEPKRRLVMDIVAPPPTPTQPAKRRRIDWGKLRGLLSKYKLSWGIGAVIVLVTAGGTLLITQWYTRPLLAPKPIASFPVNRVKKSLNFRLYYLKQGFSTDYSLQHNSIDVQDGVLIFELKNPSGSKLAVTEEATPPNISAESFSADQNFNTEYGQAYVSDQGINRTTGTLFTSDKTWILINAPHPIGATLMEQILENFAPVETN